MYLKRGRSIICGYSIDEKIVVFTQIHQGDVGDFDSFVAQMERLMILDSKSVVKGVE